MKNNIDIDNLFRDHIRDGEAAPSHYVWGDIKDKLDGQKRRKNTVFILRIAASVVIAVGLGFVYLMLNNTGKHNGKAITVNVVKKQAGSDKPNTYKNDSGKTDYKNINVADRENSALALSSENSRNVKTVIVSKDSRNKVIQRNNNIQKPEITGPVKNNEPLIADNIKKQDSVSNEIKETIAENPVVYDNSKHADSIPSNYIAQYKIDSIKNSFIVQEEENKSKKHRWQIAGQGSPIYAYRTGGQDQNQNQDIVGISGEQIESTEKPLISFSTGVNLKCQINDRLSVESGLYYSKIGQNTDNFVAYKYENDNSNSYSVNTSSGNVSCDSVMVTSMSSFTVDSMSIYGNQDISAEMISNYRLVQNFEYLEIPLLVSYKILSKKISLNVSGGLNANVLVGNKAFILDDDKKNVGKTENMNSLLCSSTLGVGVEYLISENLAFNIEPAFKYYLTTITPATKSNNYYFALYTGISYMFR